jgi:predicted transcriptional regulator of viral defense system
MLVTIEELRIKFKDYSDIQGKIKRGVEKGIYIPVIRGLYETNRITPGYYLSSYIYGPSYLSFDYALSYYGLIPERVTLYTSATFNKRKSKIYSTPFGNYHYRDIPKSAFPYDVNVIEENNYVYHIATKEKAICDKLYLIKSVSSIKELKEVLFDNLRIDRDQFYMLDKDQMLFLSKKYHSKTLRTLEKLLEESKHESY